MANVPIEYLDDLTFPITASYDLRGGSNPNLVSFPEEIIQSFSQKDQFTAERLCSLIDEKAKQQVTVSVKKHSNSNNIGDEYWAAHHCGSTTDDFKIQKEVAYSIKVNFPVAFTFSSSSSF